MIEWRANRPKWEQIADVIRERIADGTYPPDSPVPSEHKIVQEFGVARGTARKVLEHLRETGEVYAVRGLGSFVAAKPGEDAAGPESDLA
ncbi:GntR family transcriptional regulator [Microbispora bryophytorum]|uniref:GntR family transcriptional regulator n=1 Tax=Microbispora bryophytorum TaxID=1460882 RepID=UPI0033E6B818